MGLLTGFMTDWRADEVRWSDSVVKTVAAESAENNALISGWAKDWIGRSIEAAGRMVPRACGRPGSRRGKGGRSGNCTCALARLGDV